MGLQEGDNKGKVDLIKKYFYITWSCRIATLGNVSCVSELGTLEFFIGILSEVYTTGCCYSTLKRLADLFKISILPLCLAVKENTRCGDMFYRCVK